MSGPLASDEVEILTQGKLAEQERQVSAAPTLVRVLGVRALAANVVNNLVGSGIFVLPATVAAILGPSAAVAYVVCAVAVGLVALCFAEVGSRVETSGGVYAYVEAAFGPYAGFLAGMLLFVSQLAASAGVANVLVGTLGVLMPALSGTAARSGLLVVLYAAIAAVNIRGTRAGARLMESLTAAKIAPLVLLVITGLFALRPEYLAGMHVPPVRDLGRASLLLFFAFMGVEGALSSSGEVRDPARTVPRAVLMGLGGVAVLYAGLQIVSQGVLGPELSAHPDAPLAATGERLFGSVGRTFILGAAAFSAFGYVSGDMLATPRILFASGHDRLLPARLGAVHARFRTPHIAIAVHAALCCAAALSGTFPVLAVLSVVGALLVYLGCCLAVFELRRRNARAGGQPFRVAGGPLVPFLACLVVLWLLSSATRAEFLAVGAVLVGASLLYLLRRRAS